MADRESRVSQQQAIEALAAAVERHKTGGSAWSAPWSRGQHEQAEGGKRSASGSALTIPPLFTSDVADRFARTVDKFVAAVDRFDRQAGKSPGRPAGERSEGGGDSPLRSALDRWAAAQVNRTASSVSGWIDRHARGTFGEGAGEPAANWLNRFVEVGRRWLTGDGGRAATQTQHPADRPPPGAGPSHEATPPARPTVRVNEVTPNPPPGRNLPALPPAGGSLAKSSEAWGWQTPKGGAWGLTPPPTVPPAGGSAGAGGAAGAAARPAGGTVAAVGGAAGGGGGGAAAGGSAAAGGAGGAAGAAAGAAIPVAVVAAAAVAMVKFTEAAYKAGEATIRMADAAQLRNFQFAEFSPSMAMVQAEAENRDTFRRMDHGEDTAPSSARLNESMQQFNDRLDKIQRVAEKFENQILSVGVDFVTGVIEPLEQVAKVADELYKRWFGEQDKGDPAGFGDMMVDVRDEEARRRAENDAFFRRALHPEQE